MKSLKISLDPNAPNTNAILGAVLSGGDPIYLAVKMIDDPDVELVLAATRSQLSPEDIDKLVEMLHIHVEMIAPGNNDEVCEEAVLSFKRTFIEHNFAKRDLAPNAVTVVDRCLVWDLIAAKFADKYPWYANW